MEVSAAHGGGPATVLRAPDALRVSISVVGMNTEESAKKKQNATKNQRVEAQIHSKEMTRVKSIKFSVLPPLTTSIARDRSRVNEMLLQNSLLINAKGKEGSTRGRLQTNEGRHGLKGASGRGRESRAREFRFLL